MSQAHFDKEDHFEKIVSIDWKFVGRDYMGFFPDNYRELKFLFSQEWEDLCDEVANEMPENLFDQFSPFLAAYGYELWNLDDQSDSYNLCIVASTDVKQFIEFWSNHPFDGEGVYFYSPERLGVEAAATVKPVKESGLTEPKQKKTLIAEVDHHLEYGGIRNRQLLQRQVIEYQADGETFYGVADLDLFPFETLDAEGFYKKWEEGFRYFQSIHAPLTIFGRRSLLKLNPKRKRLFRTNDWFTSKTSMILFALQFQGLSFRKIIICIVPPSAIAFSCSMTKHFIELFQTNWKRFAICISLHPTC